MNYSEITRRRMIGQSALAASIGALGTALAPTLSAAETSPKKLPGFLNVMEFGAVGDGKTDDTEAFKNACKAASSQGGNTIMLPRGDYLIKDRLTIPENVSLEGVFRAPTARTQNRGSCLLAVADADKPDGRPFITLHQNATLRGLTVFYPDQKMTSSPTPYPWTIRGSGDNCSLIDVLLVNPYQAVDFGTTPAGRHLIKGLYGQPLYKGLFIDKCYDVGRVEDVHFWPFWGGWEKDLGNYTRDNGTAFIIGRTDWEYLFNCFCIGYHVGFQFISTPDGAPNCVLTQCGSDIGPTAVRVDACQDHSGVSFVNGQFMAGIEIQETNRGPVKFTACGFWGIPSTDNHAILKGKGHTTFNGCHFIGWGQKDRLAPAIHARNGGLTVTACDFMDKGKAQLKIESGVDAALVFGNRFREKELITNDAKEKSQISLNVVSS